MSPWSRCGWMKILYTVSNNWLVKCFCNLQRFIYIYIDIDIYIWRKTIHQEWRMVPWVAPARTLVSPRQTLTNFLIPICQKKNLWTEGNLYIFRSDLMWELGLPIILFQKLWYIKNTPNLKLDWFSDSSLLVIRCSSIFSNK